MHIVPFLAHERQYRRMGLVRFVTSSQCFMYARNKLKQGEIALFFYKIPDSCIVFGCNNKSYSKNARALHRIPFIAVSEKEKNGSILQSLFLCLFRGRMNPEMTSQSKLDPFSCIVSMGQKSVILPCFERVQHLKEKSRTKNFYRHSKQGNSAKKCLATMALKTKEILPSDSTVITAY